MVVQLRKSEREGERASRVSVLIMPHKVVVVAEPVKCAKPKSKLD